MTRAPVVLVSADVAPQGIEMADSSVSLSDRYSDALLEAGALPLILPAVTETHRLAEYVARCDGLMLTGGEDLDPRLYNSRLSAALRQKVKLTPDGGRRDLKELLLVEQAFRQRKPLLGICRGHQVLNVALGGTLYADLPSEHPSEVNHRRMDARLEPVHEVRLTDGSLLARITGKPAIGVNSTHHQAVKKVAAPLRATALSTDGVVEALELKPGGEAWLPFLLSVQFHPERLVDRYPEHAAIFRAFTEACAANKTQYEG